MKKIGKQLALFIVLHVEAKKLLKMFGFSQKSKTNLPLTSRGSIVGLFKNKAHFNFENFHSTFGKLFQNFIMISFPLTVFVKRFCQLKSFFEDFFMLSVIHGGCR